MVAGREQALHDERRRERVEHAHVLRNAARLDVVVPVERAVARHHRAIQVLLLVRQVPVATRTNMSTVQYNVSYMTRIRTAPRPRSSEMKVSRKSWASHNYCTTIKTASQHRTRKKKAYADADAVEVRAYRR